MNNVQSLRNTAWESKYHVVWIPKYRKKKQYGKLRVHLGTLIKDLARQKESTVVEGHLMGDHVHMLLSIPPKYAVSQAIGLIKGKSAIYIARTYVGQRKNFTGQNFWARGYFVSTMGMDEEAILEYIRIHQETGKRRPTV
jgi:putative transposase